MRILLSWLQDFVELPEYPEEIAETLTMAGLAVDAVHEQEGETVFELDITANRPDALNHFGIARELGAIYRRLLTTPAVGVSESEEPASSKASIEIEDADLCARYSGRVLLDVAVKPSPGWMRKRLELCGVRSHQQHCGSDELRTARAGASHACVRPGFARSVQDHRAAGA